MLEVIRNLPKPKVLFLSASQNPKQREIFAWIKPDRSKKKIKQRFDWIDCFNQRWKELTEAEDVERVAFLFCIQVNAKTLQKSGKCFALEKVDAEDFDNWVAEVEDALQNRPDYNPGILFSLLNDYRIKFKETLEEQGRAFPIIYRQFKDQTKARNKLCQ